MWGLSQTHTKKPGQEKTCLHRINREWKLQGLQQNSVCCRSVPCTLALQKTEIMPLFINGLLKIEMSLFLARKLPDFFSRIQVGGGELCIMHGKIHFLLDFLQLHHCCIIAE